MSGRLQGRTAVVTGGSRGIGAAVASAFVREGARVVVASRKQEALDETAAAIVAEHGGVVLPMACHTGRPDDVAALFERVERELGPVDVLVNNAATNPYFGPMIEVEWAAWDKTFDVNLKGYFEASRQLAKACLRDGRPGAIVNVASIFGQVGAPLQGVYAMTKAAVISMTKTLAVEWGGAGIRVNAIAPGLVETRFASALVSDPEILRRYTDRAALHRHGQPDEIAGIAVMLASDEASYVTGQTFTVDGGYTVSG